ncbi:MAG TPA: uroporphyrinogen decarboxylase family protein [Candidatus Borkfalkia excrementigallinarum]|uniref:Uroporphyrinogen decarboxylase family protein n=1 Tax=Candidatus Borkfalkia excrementigallinarum TaxID=2838506 RepID=A0A9D1ZTM8_9FIRM|nr:uroporphyrinogen decarboxylase family protein [Candidatus Borkfalkia excrementigallinarum]
MKRDMKAWLSDMLHAETKKAMPVLSFPGASLLGIDVKELIFSSDNQAKAMAAVAQRVDSAASVSLMDLSVEAECFGAPIHISEDEVPTVTGCVVSSPEEADALKVPHVGAGRTEIYIDAIRKAAELIQDRPVFAGVIGPFSLAGRLVDVTEAMIYCYEEPEMMHTVLSKATDFLIEYIKAYKEAGANGVVMAEPLAGLLSPDLAEEFSSRYVKKINEAVKSDDFLVIYHNCGNTTILTIDSILSTGSDAYHFGNAIDMAEMMKHIPADTIAMGNVDPAGVLRNGTPETVKQATKDIMGACCGYGNFVISSGCDIPPATPWKNIDAFFEAVNEFYQGK